MRTVPMISLGKGCMEFGRVKVTSAEYMQAHSLAKLPGFDTSKSLLRHLSSSFAFLDFMPGHAKEDDSPRKDRLLDKTAIRRWRSAADFLLSYERALTYNPLQMAVFAAWPCTLRV